jgi:membrane-associated progesterone receptor component
VSTCQELARNKKAHKKNTSKVAIMSLTTILLLLAFAAVAYYAYTTFGPQKKKKSTQSSEAAQHGVHFSDSDSDSDSDSSDDEDDEKEFTLEELAKYDGTNESVNKKIYISVMGNVFDVTHSGFYGPEDAYGVFAGKDATVNLATTSTDSSTLNTIDIAGFTISQKQDMHGQVEFYSMKYKRVGWLKEWNEVNHGDDEKKNN